MTTSIAECTPTEAGLADIRHRFEGVTFDVATTKGNAEARAARMELVKLRTGLETKRKELKAPALAHCQLIDAEAARIKGEIVKLEDPIDALIKVEEDRKAAEKAERDRIEAERIASLHAQIADINAIPATCVGIASVRIADALSDMQSMVIELDRFAELTGTAMLAQQNAVTQLLQMLTAQQAHEAEQARIKAEREELARRQDEQRRIEAEAAAVRLRAEEAAKAAQAELYRVAAESRAAEQAKIDAQTAELRREQDAFRAEVAAARVKAEQLAADEKKAADDAEVLVEFERAMSNPAPVEPTQIVEVPVAQKPKVPTTEQMLEVLASHYLVTTATVREWLNLNQKAA